jgi:Mg2+-importing ATPase
VLLRQVFDAGPALFHSGWFVVSLLTELAVVLVLRTRGPAWQSRPSPLLLGATAVVALLALALPYSGPPAALLGLAPLPAPVLAALLGVVIAYAAATEVTKRWFWRGSR